MNRYGPVVLMVAGVLVTAAIGGAVTVLDADIPFTESDQSMEVAAEQPTQTSTPRLLRVPTSSASVNDGQVDQIRIEAAVENPHDTAVEEVIAVRVDVDGDGTFELTAGKQSLSVSAGETVTVTFPITTSRLDPGTYEYVVEMADGTVEFATGAFTLQAPSVHLSSVNASTNVTQGTPVPVSIGVTNVGDLPANRTVTLDGPSGTDSRTVEIAAGQTETLNFTVGTASLSRGNYTYTVSTDTSEERFEVRVRSPRFEVSDLSGTETYTAGEELAFSAQLRNTGDARGVQQVELRIDVDDDDTPESVGFAEEVRLAPGEGTTVTFTIDRDQWYDAAPETSRIGSHIIGIYTNDTNVTGVFAVKQTSSDESEDTADDSQDLASRDEISQEKYGTYYSALSHETEVQVDELYTRQPFANGLVITEVLTREEIAREEFGHDVEPGEPFTFTDLDIQIQQEVEAMFDAQFTSEQGDRIESWDELAQQQYGHPYDQLTAEQKEAIREAYLEQFDGTG